MIGICVDELQPGQNSSGWNLLAVKTAPCGSASTVILTGAASNGGDDLSTEAFGFGCAAIGVVGSEHDAQCGERSRSFAALASAWRPHRQPAALSSSAIRGGELGVVLRKRRRSHRAKNLCI